MKINFFDSVFGFGDPDSTGQRIFRKVFELFIVYAACDLAWYWGRYTLRIADVVLPLGLARYMDISFMHGNNLPLFIATAISLLMIGGFLSRARWPYALAFVLLLLQYAARFTLGEIPHSSNLIGMGVLGYALGRACFSDQLEGSRFAIGFSYLSIGLGYTFAAWSKLIGTGLSWPDGRHLWMWINEKAVDEMARSGFVELNFLQEWALSSYTVATLFLLVGLLTEFFAFMFWFKRFRFATGLAILGLHIGIWITMDILFKLSVWELLILSPPWAYWIDAYLKKREGAVIRLNQGA